ncbi:hypothetical protein E2C01_025141 [Portunus trituberculatus]|uniref:Uncharacterized protein n=1 Tax=Portunus trituberculatus TaxID=210409 RepID=A0A5B7ECH1_PORTR|nr:hypothetical protein [Portunus trituberculatus]
MKRSASEPVLPSYTHRTPVPTAGHSTDLSTSQHSLDIQDVEVSCHQPSDISLVMQLMAVGLVGTVKGCAKAGQGTGRRRMKLPSAGISKLQTLMHLGRIHSSISPSLPEMCKVTMVLLLFVGPCLSLKQGHTKPLQTVPLAMPCPHTSQL